MLWDISVEKIQVRTNKIQDSRFKHRLFRENTDIHIYNNIMTILQNMFLNGNII